MAASVLPLNPLMHRVLNSLIVRIENGWRTLKTNPQLRKKKILVDSGELLIENGSI
jgi:hypothetical protein